MLKDDKMPLNAHDDRKGPLDVTLAVLADFASVTREGKLNIMGIFEQVKPYQFSCCTGSHACSDYL